MAKIETWLNANKRKSPPRPAPKPEPAKRATRKGGKK